MHRCTNSNTNFIAILKQF